MRLIDADMEVTAQLFDDMHEEYREVKMPISVFLDLYTNEGCPSAEKQGEWTPCSESLPKKPDIYTVTDSKGDVVRFVFHDTESSREYWLRCAKAWMPLPEPWKG